MKIQFYGLILKTNGVWLYTYSIIIIIPYNYNQFLSKKGFQNYSDQILSLYSLRHWSPELVPSNWWVAGGKGLIWTPFTECWTPIFYLWSNLPWNVTLACIIWPLHRTTSYHRNISLKWRPWFLTHSLKEQHPFPDTESQGETLFSNLNKN